MLNFMHDPDKTAMRAFFGAYFHQDWQLEAQNPDSVIIAYIKDATNTTLIQLRTELLAFLNDCLSDHEIEQKLFREFACYYQPSMDGISARGWLQDLVQKLHKS